jgi:hypothetical protein
VSIPSCRERNSQPSSLRARAYSIRSLRERPSRPKLPDDEAVAFPEVTYRLLETGPLGFGAADLVGVNLLAAGLLEGVLLEVEVLLAS